MRRRNCSGFRSPFSPTWPRPSNLADCRSRRISRAALAATGADVTTERATRREARVFPIARAVILARERERLAVEFEITWAPLQRFRLATALRFVSLCPPKKSFGKNYGPNRTTQNPQPRSRRRNARLAQGKELPAQKEIHGGQTHPAEES